MKLRSLFYILFVLLLTACIIQSTSRMKSLEGTSDDFKKYAVKEFKQGETLYKKYCASCHGIFGQGNADAPNFSSIAIHNYNASYIKGDKENHAVAQGLDEESFQKILFFLSYREP